MVVRVVRSAALVCLVGCFCQRCGNPESFDEPVNVDIALGDPGTACTGSDTVDTDNGQFEISYAIELGDDGADRCTATATWLGGSLLDLAEVRDEAEARIDEEAGSGLSRVGILIEGMDFTALRGLSLTQATGSYDPVAAEVQMVLVDPGIDVGSDAVFDRTDGFVVFAFDKPAGAPLPTALDLPRYGPADPADYGVDGSWPYLDRANRALDVGAELPISARVRVSVPLAELAALPDPNGMAMRLDTTLRLTVGVYACGDPVAGGFAP